MLCIRFSFAETILCSQINEMLILKCDIKKVVFLKLIYKVAQFVSKKRGVIFYFEKMDKF